MSFPRYPKYKDSGVEWLGQVPNHWDVKRIGYYFVERREKVSDKDFPALSVTKNGIVPQLDTAAKSDDGDNRKKVLKGDFVINSRSDRKGSSGASDLDGSVSLICTVMRPQEKVHTPFVHHLLRSQPFQEEFYRYGKGIVADLWSTNYSEMRNILLGMPPLPEQTRIAAFLDQETAKIDALVAEQERLMALLKEKRQAIISHAVTKGLNPKAAMKSSGIEWLGDVPTHWEIVPLKYVISMKSGGTPSKENLAYWDGDVPWASSKDLKTETLSDTQDHITQKALDDGAAELEPAGSLLTVVRGMILLHTFPVVRTLVPMAINQDLKALSPNSKVTPDFLAWLLRGTSAETLARTDEAAHGTKVLRIETWTSMPVPIPPLAEQSKIVAGLTEQLGELGALTAEAQRAIDLLQERRTALISAAVTGQIDVHNR